MRGPSAFPDGRGSGRRTRSGHEGAGRDRRGGDPGIAPRRTCIGCRRVAPADELVRVVGMADGSLTVGRTLPGRGAWLCAGSMSCLEAAVRHKAFARALRAEVAPQAVGVLRARLIDRARIEGSEIESGRD